MMRKFVIMCLFLVLFSSCTTGASLHRNYIISQSCEEMEEEPATKD